MIGGQLEHIADNWNQALNRPLIGMRPPRPEGLDPRPMFSRYQHPQQDAGSGSGVHATVMATPGRPGMTLGQAGLGASAGI